MMIFFWILIAAVLFYSFSDHVKAGYAGRQESSAEEILKMRYINGEINQETFETMKRTIKN